MHFNSISILETIKSLYKLPLSKRFEQYLFLLQGDQKNKLILPISGFNPMAKEIAIAKLESLIALNAEAIAKEQIEHINKRFSLSGLPKIDVGINLIDDIQGAWSNFYTTNFKSKFDFKGLYNQNFCCPFFWVSEDLNERIIQERIESYLLRSIYFHKNRPLDTLAELLMQEEFVWSNRQVQSSLKPDFDHKMVKRLFNEHKNDVTYAMKFNFFYGDEASKSLSYTTFGFPPNAGFHYAKYLAEEKKYKN